MSQSDAATRTSVLLLMFVGTITDERLDASRHIHQCKCRLASLPCLQTQLSALDRPIRQSTTDYQGHGPPITIPLAYLRTQNVHPCIIFS